MSYEIIERLKRTIEEGILSKLASYVNEADRVKGQLHEVFELSFDWKECIKPAFISQKLNYIHRSLVAVNGI